MTKVNTGEKIHKPKKGKGSYNRNDISLKWPLNSECVGRAGFNFKD
jgi:stalled ribosome alternative rescue factor ArfA